jgi:hypothetical protein
MNTPYKNHPLSPGILQHLRYYLTPVLMDLRLRGDDEIQDHISFFSLRLWGEYYSIKNGHKAPVFYNQR